MPQFQLSVPIKILELVLIYCVLLLLYCLHVHFIVSIYTVRDTPLPALYGYTRSAHFVCKNKAHVLTNEACGPCARAPRVCTLVLPLELWPLKRVQNQMHNGECALGEHLCMHVCVHVCFIVSVCVCMCRVCVCVCVCVCVYLHSSSSKGSSPVGFLAMRSRHSWSSPKLTEDHTIPSKVYSACSVQ